METSNNSQINDVQISEDAKFSFGQAVLYGINAVIGSGIFLVQTGLYKDLGPASLLAMVGVMVLVFMLALCFAEVAGYFDKNGGAYQYSKAAFGDFVGFNVGLLGWFVTTVAWGAMAAGLARLITIQIPSLAPYHIALSVGIVILLSLMNVAGIKTSKIFTVVVTCAKLIPIFVFAFCALFFMKHGIDAGHFSPFLQLNPDMTLGQALSSTAVTIFYAFIGFETLPIVAGEMRDAKRNVPKAIISSISIVSVLYIIITAGAIAMLGQGILQTDAPVQEAFKEMVGPIGFSMINIGAIISVAGLNMGESIMIPRYGAAIADEGQVPAIIGKKNAKGAPIVSIAISAVVTIILLFSGEFETLATLSVVFRFGQYIPAALAVPFLRKRTDMPTQTSFHVPFGPWLIPLLAVTVSIVMLIMAEGKNVIYLLIGIVVASILYFVINPSRKKA
ncbi:APC family permease [Vaginisenegalia massiliensis]|uniref:APC family permease n=1 Tax=Vaginisenegalia massiliensis TaxID=2058294 RepID=UPI000F524B07|nr:APC family permease [Vaginisenegalia massiliensis]